MATHYVVTKSRDGQLMFSLKAPDGHILLTSGWYGTPSALEGGMEAVRTNSPLDERYGRLADDDGKPYFVLKAVNGMVVGRSEAYPSPSAMEEDIARVGGYAASASIVEEQEK